MLAVPLLCIEGEHFLTRQPIVEPAVHLPVRVTEIAKTINQLAPSMLRAYQQHLSRVAADAQVDLTRVTEQHVQKTSQTARALADEVARVASEETERGMRKQEESIRQFSDPFNSDGKNIQASRGNSNGGGSSATMQSGSPGSSQTGGHDGADAIRPPSGSSTQPGARPGGAGRTS